MARRVHVDQLGFSFPEPCHPWQRPVEAAPEPVDSSVSWWTEVVSYDRALALLSPGDGSQNLGEDVLALAGARMEAWHRDDGRAYCAYRSIMAHLAALAVGAA